MSISVTSMPRAVFDTTVLISAFLKGSGISGELLSLAGDAFILVISPEIVAETERKLLTKERLRKSATYTDDQAREYCRGLSELAELVTDLPPLSGVVRDPNDDMIVATAVKASADYLVSRDKDLLTLGRHQDTTIMTPEAFRGLLRAQRA